ncbi:MAG: helix-turn-helix domain-containing protein [Lentisphaeria bacterium]|nr:helix-turn-helix domain-containing protein [Lentisphaeria bacterium]
MERERASVIRTPVESLRKGLEVLELLSRANSATGLPLVEVASRMGYKRTSAHNLLKTLALCGYARNDGEGRYGLGWKATQLLRNRLASGVLGPAVAPLLSELASQLDESVVLTTLVDGCRRVVARARGTQLIQVDPHLFDGEDKSMWGTVTGRVLAAFSDAEELRWIFQCEGAPGEEWPEAGTSAAGMEDALATVRKARMAEENEEAASLAVPVLTGERLLGALGVHLPEFRWNRARRTEFLPAMRHTATRLARVWHE